MRILYLTAWYPTPNKPTYAVFVREHALASQLYHEVQVLHVVCQRSSNERGSSSLTLQYKQGERVPVTHAYIDLPSRYGLGDLYYSYYVARALTEIGFNPDLVHCNITLPTGIAAIWLKRRLHVPLVLTEHGGDYLYFYGQTRISKLKARIVLRSADRVMPVSEGQRKVMHILEPGGRYSVIPNAVDTTLFRPARPGSGGQLEALSVGSLLPVKGHQFLLRAYAQLPKESRQKLKLRIVGDGYLRDALMELQAELKLDHEVAILPGGRPKSEIASMMNGCDFLVQPSLREATPCVIIEAMACGKPVVATICGGSEYLVGPEMGLLVEKGNVDALAEALEAMIDGCHRYDGPWIAQQAKDNYSYEAVGRQFDAIYRSVTAR